VTVITFIKGFHRSLAFVLPSITWRCKGELVSAETSALLVGGGEGLKVHLLLLLADLMKVGVGDSDCASMADIHKYMSDLQLPEVSARGGFGPRATRAKALGVAQLTPMSLFFFYSPYYSYRLDVALAQQTNTIQGQRPIVNMPFKLSRHRRPA
jgi:hypothetical protein